MHYGPQLLFLLFTEALVKSTLRNFAGSLHRGVFTLALGLLLINIVSLMMICARRRSVPHSLKLVHRPGTRKPADYACSDAFPRITPVHRQHLSNFHGESPRTWMSFKVNHLFETGRHYPYSSVLLEMRRMPDSDIDGSV